MVSKCPGVAGTRLRRQAGQAYTEYGLILILIAITVIGTLTILGQQVFAMWHQISAGMPHP